jgi:outer membrane protein OmpA-like peptidoglycan-associated protein
MARQIYSLLLITFLLVQSALAQEIELSGVVKNKKSDSPVEAVLYLINSIDREQIAMYTTNGTNGKYKVSADPGNYFVKVVANGYMPYRQPVALAANNGRFYVKDVLLTPELPEVNLVFRKDKQYINTDVIFTPGSDKLDEKAKTELDRVAPFLNENESFIFEIGGHVDSVGFVKNLGLKRAMNAFEYLVDNGVNGDQLSVKDLGYDEIATNTDYKMNRNDIVSVMMVGRDFQKVTKVIEEGDDHIYEEDLDRINNLTVMFKRKKSKIHKSQFVILDSVRNFLINFANLEVKVKGYTDAKFSKEKANELANRRNLAVVSYLSNNGVAKKRITWKAFGKKDPVATSMHSKGRKLNNRVEFEVTGSTGNAGRIVKIDREIKKEAPKTGTSAEETFKSILESYGSKQLPELSYTIQIGAFVTELPATSVLLQKFPTATGKQYPDGIWRYTIGSFANLEEANAFRATVQSSGVNDAFVLGIHKGQRLTVYQLQKLLNR